MVRVVSLILAPIVIWLWNYAPPQELGLTGVGGAPSVSSAMSFVQFALGDSGNEGNCDSNVTGCPTPNFTSSVGSGHMIAVCGEWAIASGNTGNSLSSVTDTLSNSFTVVSATKEVVDTTTDYGEIGVECAYSTTGNGGTDAVTCTFAKALETKLCAAWELSGQQSSPLDQTSVGTGTTSTTISAGTVTTTHNGEIAITAGIDDDGNGGATMTAGSGWTKDGSQAAGDFLAGAEHIAQTSSGNLTGSYTTNKTPHDSAAAMFTFY